MSTTTPHTLPAGTLATWPASYIGLPWEAGAQGPESYDCMGFFRHVQGAHFGIDVPPILAPSYDDPAVLVALFKTHAEHQNWHRIPQPEHGCAVIVHRPMHIGVWLEQDGGGVLHCVQGVGVIFTHRSTWPVSSFGRCEYYRHASAGPAPAAPAGGAAA
jgi:hypothetical protein